MKITPNNNVQGGSVATPVTLIDVTIRENRNKEPDVFGETPFISRKKKQRVSDKVNDAVSELT